LGSLPARLGGAGVLDPVQIHAPAALASFLSAAQGSTGILLTRLPPDLTDAFPILRRSVPEMVETLATLWSVGSLSDIISSPKLEVWAEQKAWSLAISEAAAMDFDRDASSRLTNLRKLQSGAHAGVWLTNAPLEKEGCAVFTPAEFQALLRFRLGAPFQANSKCGGCAAVLDCFGDHALSCVSCGLYSRHNRLRDALASEHIIAGEAVQVEVNLPGVLTRPADIMVAEPSDATPAAVDVSVVHPLHLSSLSAEITPGAAAASREAEKTASSAAACGAEGWRFHPVCVETTGAWGPGAQKHVRAIIRRQSMRSGEGVGATASAVWGRLATAVAKGAAQMLLRAFPSTFGLSSSIYC
jgi:hypothetical protein